MRKVFYNSILAYLLLRRKGFRTAMFFGLICTKRKKSDPLSDKTINHESIHVEQYIEVTAVAMALAFLLTLIFGGSAWVFLVFVIYYIIYFVEAAISWVHNFFAYRKKDAGAAADKAYYNSMFEMEAHTYEGYLSYLATRTPFNWIRYFGKI